ncbi:MULTISPECIES: Bug family tripartite tricarboxylate transporter substrate binding protein [Alcaligenes]|uniref:ABC transporter substrate-binding protein n=2 Tax=Alcaligenes TaxID=507 RepID=A0AB33CWK7_ALCFA|nr:MULTISPECIES: tripartite tricarboxylate transporter substrate binding protein [Alcaligenes]ASR90915.1 ABC transporter substrate-binding protein [Alcaligenes faecalis]AYN22193.1 tripartite tricarboxylate transporter substrate binding protein [Alcaligenes aquatilis]MCC9164544.1 tripartite tricarboxylate transporter substrate binding protein [Alcaligenes sp. MMA]QXR35580.1 tripartite tricarboxylate transporter substrate binding protein [Alcaligenes aquatilis]UYY86892.1 tripartite tricarboxylat
MSLLARSRDLLIRSVLGLACTGLLAPSAQAQSSWPERPIQMVVPFPAGSSPDALARAISEPLSQALGQTVIVDNRPGAGGNIGTRFVAHAKPDGYTLLLTINGPMVTAPTLYKSSLGYDPLKDLQAISMIGTSPNVLIVPADSPANTVEEFIALAKSQPGELNYGSVGPGSSAHLAMAMLEHAVDIKLEQIPYSGFPQILTAIIGGDIDAAFMVPGIAMPQVEAGKVKALAVTSLQPSELLPGLKTMTQAGLENFEAISWDAFFVPHNTSDDVVKRLNQEITTILQREDIKAKLNAFYFSSEPSTPQALTDKIIADKARWDEVIERLNLSLE